MLVIVHISINELLNIIFNKFSQKKSNQLVLVADLQLFLMVLSLVKVKVKVWILDIALLT